MAKPTAPRPDIRVGPTIGPRPLPKAIIEVFYQSEDEFQRTIKELEKSKVFKQLVNRGVVQRVKLKGRIPQHRYEEYKDSEMLEFFEKYEITEHFDWQQDFFDQNALKRRHQIARKYKVPVGQLTRVLRYCRYIDQLASSTGAAPVQLDQDHPDFLQFQASEAVFDTQPLIEQLSALVVRWKLCEKEFRRLFFSAHVDEEEILEHVSASRQEIRAVREIVERIQLLNSFQVDIRPRTTRSSRRKVEPVAEIVVDGLNCNVAFLGNQIYDVKYRFGGVMPSREKLSREEQEFVERLKAVNQRKNVFSRLLLFLVRYQSAYFISGEDLQLRPLTQAQAASELDEEEATVSRIIRDKFVATPKGLLTVKSFFHKVGKVVELLLREEEAKLASGEITKPYTDDQLQKILADRYKVNISRRCVTYHRNKRRTGGNYYRRLGRTAGVDEGKKTPPKGKGS